MQIINLRKQKVVTIVVAATLLTMTLGLGRAATAAGNPPTIQSHADVMATATSSSGTTVDYTLPYATDDSGNQVAVVCGPISGSNFDIGTTTVTCTATNDSGTSSTTFNVLASLMQNINGGGITFTPSQMMDIATTTYRSSGIVVDYAAPTAKDSSGNSLTVSCSPASGTMFPVGSTTVTCTSSDSSGNSASTSFRVGVTLLPSVDVSILGSNAHYYFLTPSQTSYTYTWISDNANFCYTDYAPTVNVGLNGTSTVHVGDPYWPTASSTDNGGFIRARITCTDGTNSHSNYVRVYAATTTQATTTPATTTPSTVTVNTPVCATTSTANITGTAATGTTVTITGNGNTVNTTTSASGNWSATIDVGSGTSTPFNVTVRDSGGNIVATSTFNASFDNTPPVITLIGNASTTLGQGSAFSDQGIIVTDNSGQAVTQTATGTVDTATVGTYTITYTATDCAGNMATAQRTVTITPFNGSGSAPATTPGSSLPPPVINNTNSVVVPGTTAGNTVFLPTTNGVVPVVLGASTTNVPGIPNTGAGGNVTRNIALIVGALVLASIGFVMVRKNRKQIS